MRNHGITNWLWNFAALFVAVVLITFLTSGQQHAPSLEQCRADLSVWYSVSVRFEYANEILSGVTPKNAEIAKLPIKEVAARQTETYQCSNVDSVNAQRYREAGEFYYIVYAQRFVSFVKRHGLEQQLFQEDDAGQR